MFGAMNRANALNLSGLDTMSVKLRSPNDRKYLEQPMAKDHFVSQTYLRPWCDPERRPPLQAYRKSGQEPFRCSPKDVCWEWDGDLVPGYLTDPSLLGQFRNIFEPKWKPTVERVGTRTINQEDKFLLSMAWAHFFLCPPAQREIIKAIYANEARALAPTLLEGHRLDPATLTIEIDRAPDFFKGFVTKHLSEATWVFYNQDWMILINDTDTPFITSDNPSAFIPGSSPPERLLPISPSLCLYAKIDMSFAEKDHFDLEQPPKRSITFCKISKHDAKEINRITVVNARDLVFSQSEDVGIEALVKKWRDYKPEVESVSFPADDGALKGATLTITPR
jgi:Protein of unknown function (DUF4238)